MTTLADVKRLEAVVKAEAAFLEQFKQEFEQTLSRIRNAKRRSQLRRLGIRARPQTRAELDAASMFTRIYGPHGKQMQLEAAQKKLDKAREEVKRARKRM